MPLAGHDGKTRCYIETINISTPMPLAGHDDNLSPFSLQSY